MFDFLKDPKIQALLAGTAIAATGGAAAPVVAGAAGSAGAAGAGAGLLGGAAATGAAGAGAASGAGASAGLLADPMAAWLATGATDASTMGSALTGAGGGAGAVGAGSTAGTLQGLKTASGYVKPVGDAMGAARQAQGLMAEPEQGPIQAAPVMTGQGGPQSLSALYQQIMQGDMQKTQEDMQRRQRRQQMLGGQV